MIKKYDIDSIPLKKVNFPCPVCGSTEYRLLYPDTLGDKLPAFDYDFSKRHNLTYRIVVCNKCTHHYASPRPQNIYVHYNSDSPDLTYLNLQTQRIETGRRVIKKMLRYCKSGKLLDVGCATGDFLSIAGDHYQVEGLELSNWATNIARQRGFVVHQCLLSDLKVIEPFDIVTLWGVIEHFEYPNREITNIYNLLKKGGILCLWTGDISSITSRIMRRNWWYIQGQHIQLFTRKSLRKLLNDNGFQELHIGKYPYLLTMDSVNNSLKRYPLIAKITRPFLGSSMLSNFRFALKLPGEIFAIFGRQ